MPTPPPLARQLATASVLVGLGVLMTTLFARVMSTPLIRDGRPLVLWALALVGLVAAGSWFCARRRPALLPPLVVATAAVVLSGIAILVLAGTAWSFDAIYSDGGFRTEAVTRFAHSPSLTDYAYRGLPSYYPPALPWLEGQLAAWSGTPAWAVVKPVTIALAAMVPLLAYASWHRILPDLAAASVAAGTSLITVDLTKPDEWLVLSVVMPWWLYVVRGAGRGERGRVSWWREGVTLGLLLLTHTFYFLPLALASLLGLGLDRLRHRAPPLRFAAAASIGAVGLAVAAPYWLPIAWLHLTGVPSDDLQRRWSDVGFTVPHLPVPIGVVGCLGLLGLVRTLWSWRRDELQRSLVLVLGVSYTYLVVGQWAQRYGVALLPEKADELIVYALVGTGLLALGDAVAWKAIARPRARGRVLPVIVGAVVVVAVAAPVARGRLDGWVGGSSAEAAQHVRYPSGGYPAGGLPTGSTHQHAWGVAPLPTDPSVRQVIEAWQRLTGRPLDDRTVLVTARADLLATTTVHPFVTWKSIYSHPNGQWSARLALLDRIARCPTPACARRLLRHNRFDRADGFVLRRTEAGLKLTLSADTFPDAWRMTSVTFPDRLFEGVGFERLDVGPVAVVALS